MAKRPLPTPEELRQLLHYDADSGILYWRPRGRDMFKSERSYRSWNAKHAGREALASISAEGYKAGTILSGAAQAHRVAWAVYYGAWPSQQIDHINRVRTDNRILNLRDVSKKENAHNMGRSKSNTSGCTGVSWSKREQKWTAYIRHDGRQRHLAYTPKFCEAVKLRKSAERAFGFSALHGT